MVWLLIVLKYAVLVLLYIFFFWVISLITEDLRGSQRQPCSKPVLVVVASRCSQVTLGARWDLGEEVLIGRGPGNNTDLPDPYVSSRHARIYLDDGKYMVEDLGSTNGTLLNGKPLIEATRLRPGDHLQVGGIVLTLILDSSRRKSLSPFLFVYPGVLLTTGGLVLYYTQLLSKPHLILLLIVAFSLSCGCLFYQLKGQGDAFLFLFTGILTSLGLVFLYRIDPVFGLRQSYWILLGLLTILLVHIFLRNYRGMLDYKYLFMALGLIFLFLTILLGTEAGGTRGWLALGSFRFQPSEAAKILLIIFLSGYLDENCEILTRGTRKIGPFLIPDWSYVGPLLAACGFSLLLLVFQRDLGMALLFFATFLVMVYIATSRLSYFLIGSLLFLGGAFLMFFLFPHVQERVAVYLNPWQYAHTGGYQIIQSLFALGNGGLLGWGLGSGFPELIPAVHTDFIFSLAGEEMGLAGTLGIILLYLLLIWRGIRISLRTREGFGCLLAFGFSSLMALQVLIILGGVIKIVPLTGIPLPFLSYGGSSLISNFLLVGILMRISEEERKEG